MDEQFNLMKVAELREVLVNKFGWNKTTAHAVKGKKALILNIKEELATENVNPDILDDLDNINITEVGIEDIDKLLSDSTVAHEEETSITEDSILYPSDPGWTNYILRELTEDEKIKDKNNPEKTYPTTDGLRRLVEKFVGTIIKSSTDVKQTPCPDNERRATVVVYIGILPERIDYDGLLEYSGAADVYIGNSAHPFFQHPVAVAETKSEGRAYKKALKIKTSTYEEVANGPSDANIMSIPIDTDGLIKSDQLNFIDILCQRLDINVQKFMVDFLPNFTQLPSQIPYDEACNLLALLQQYQGDGKDSKKIEEKIVGYQAGWQNEFVSNVALLKN